MNNLFTHMKGCPVISLGFKQSKGLALTLFFGIFFFLFVPLSYGQQWQTLASLPSARFQHASAAYNGKVYIITGTSTGSALHNTLFVYDVQSNTWSTGTAFTGGGSRGGDGASDGNGNIYFVSGIGTTGAEKKLYKFEITSNTWSEISGSYLKSAWNGTLEYHNGKLYHLGGEGAETQLNIYTISTNTWSTGATIIGGGGMMHASAVIGDKIYMIGGTSAYTPGNQTVKVYDIPTNTWTLLPSSANFPHNAYYFDAVAYGGEVYLTGGSDTGYNTGGNQFNYYYKFKPTTNTWERLADLPTGQGQHTLVELDATLYSIGGYNSNSGRTYVYTNVLANGGVVASNLFVQKMRLMILLHFPLFLVLQEG